MLVLLAISQTPIWRSFRQARQHLIRAVTSDARSSLKQRSWDEPGLQSDKTTLWNSASDVFQKARLAAVSASHSGDWLHARPISSCGLRLEDEAIRVAVGLRLGVDLCHPHRCPCGATVDGKGIHGFFCKTGSGSHAETLSSQ